MSAWRSSRAARQAERRAVPPRAASLDTHAGQPYSPAHGPDPELPGGGAVPLELERYDLIIPDHFPDLSPVRILPEMLRSAGIHREVAALGGYDMASLGLVC